jgi:hypothetical protein
MSDDTKDERKNERRHQRLEQHPEDAQNGLLVADSDVAIGQGQQKIAVTQNLAKLGLHRGRSRPNVNVLSTAPGY